MKRAGELLRCFLSTRDEREVDHGPPLAHGEASREPGRCATGRGARPRPGFTLVELLVVMAVIAVLAALLFPVLA